MLTTSATSSYVKGQVGTQNPNGYDAFQELDLNAFLSMMIAELQNQDPMNPMDNAQLLQQVSQIREIESNMRLTTTLESLGRAQNLASGAALIGKQIRGLNADGNEIAGVVQKVSADEKGCYLHLEEGTVSMTNIKEIVSPQSEP